MLNLHRVRVVLISLILFAGSAAAQVGTRLPGTAGPLACTANAAGTPQLRSEGYTELIGDILITCTGGTLYYAGSLVPTTNITVYMTPNLPVTSRLFSGYTHASEALLLIDDPGSTLPTGATGAYGPRAPQVRCATLMGGCATYVGMDASNNYQVAVNAVGSTTAAANIYTGVVGALGANTVTFYGVPVLPTYYNGVTRTFRITNIRIPTIGIGNGAGVNVFLSTNPSTVLPMSLATLPVGIVADPGLVPSVQRPNPDGSTMTGGQATSNPALVGCNAASPTPSLNLLFKEGFATGFKTRVVPMSNTAFAAEAVNDGTQNIPGGLYGGLVQNSESGFILPNAQFGNFNQYAAGLADFGTRLKAVFTNIPAGVTVYVSGINREGWNFSNNTPIQVVGGTGAKASAVLIYAGGAGSDAIAEGTPLNQSYAPVALTPNASGTATAIWEVTNSDPGGVETFTFTLYIASSTSQPPLGAPVPNVAMSLAPEPGGGAFTAQQGPVATTNIIPRAAILHSFSAPFLSLPASCDAPVPTIISVSPSQLTAGTGPLSLNITGANFAAAAATTWNGVVTGTTTFVNSSSLKVLLPFEALATSGVYVLGVTNPGNVPATGGFTVTVNPVLVSVSPNAIAAGGPNAPVTITGSGFTTTDVVYLGSTALATTYVNSSQLTAIVPAASLVAGVVQVKVADASAGTTSNLLPLTVAAGVPTLSYLDPPSATSGGPAVAVKLIGSGFTAATTVNGFGSLPVTYVSPTQLTVTVPASTLASSGRFTVSASNPGGLASGSLNFLVAPAEKWTLQQQLTLSASLGNEGFGAAVAISGDTAIVGAPNGNAHSGEADVFVRSGGVWTRQQILTASDGSAADLFGYTVAISGDTAVVDAIHANASQGAVYVFVRTGTTWTQQQKLSPPPLSPSQLIYGYGGSLGISGDTVVVKAGSRVDVYTRSAGTWSIQQILTASDVPTGFSSVSIAGNTMVIGSNSDNDRGAAYVFVRSSGVWTLQQKLTATDGATGDLFGSAVSISADTAFIGAVGRNGNKGAVYAFIRNGTVWTQQQELVAPNGNPNDLFGYSVSVNGDTAIVGTDSQTGGAYATTWTDGVWSAPQDVTALVPAAQRCDYLGASVSVSGGSAVFGGRGCAFVIQSGIPFFAGSVNVGGSTQYLQFPNGNPFGYFSVLSDGWIFHTDLGYEYVSPGNGTDVYLWDLSSGHWWYTSASNFPYLYDFTLKSWIFYFPDTHNSGRYTSNPRYFANMTTGQTFPL